MSNPRRWKSEDLLSAADTNSTQDGEQNNFKQSNGVLSNRYSSTMHLSSNKEKEPIIDFRSVLRNKVQVNPKQVKKYESDKPSWLNRRKTINVDVLEKRNKNFAVNSNTPVWMNVLRKSKTDLTKLESTNKSSEVEKSKRDVDVAKPNLNKNKQNGSTDNAESAFPVKKEIISKPIIFDDNNNEVIPSKLKAKEKDKTPFTSFKTKDDNTIKTSQAKSHGSMRTLQDKNNNVIRSTQARNDEMTKPEKDTNETEFKITYAKNKDSTKPIRDENNNGVFSKQSENKDTGSAVKIENRKSVDETDTGRKKSKTSITKSNILRKLSLLDEMPKQRKISSDKINLNQVKSLAERKKSLTEGNSNKSFVKRKESIPEKFDLDNVLRKKSVEIDININISHSTDSTSTEEIISNKTKKQLKKTTTEANNDKRDEFRAEVANVSPQTYEKPVNNRNKNRNGETLQDVKKSKSDEQPISKSYSLRKQSSELTEILENDAFKNDDDSQETSVMEAAKEIASRQKRFRELKLSEEERKERRHRESRRQKKSSKQQDSRNQFNGEDQTKSNVPDKDENGEIQSAKSRNVKEDIASVPSENKANLAEKYTDNSLTSLANIDSEEKLNSRKVDDKEVENGNLEIEKPVNVTLNVQEKQSSNESNGLDLSPTKHDKDESKTIMEKPSQIKSDIEDVDEIRTSEVDSKTEINNSESQKNGNLYESHRTSLNGEASIKEKTSEISSNTESSMESLSQRIRRRQSQQSQEDGTEIDFAARRRARRAKRLEEENAAF